MTTTYLGFLQNRQNREEFVAPVVAADVTLARTELGKAYPESRYIIQTIYSRTELEHVLSGIDRWPGVPSKVQPPVTADLSKVTARTGGLPPLPGQVTNATVEKVTDNTQGIPAWMQSLVQPQTAPAPVRAAPAPTAAPAKPANMQAMLQAMAQTRAAAPQPMQAQPQSLIERLKAAKGETVTPNMPAMPAAAVQSAVKPGSVIDILKSMRK